MVTHFAGTLFLKHVIEGKNKDRTEVTGKRGETRQQIMENFKETRWYWESKGEVLDRTLWRTRFEDMDLSLGRLRIEWMNVWLNEWINDVGRAKLWNAILLVTRNIPYQCSIRKIIYWCIKCICLIWLCITLLKKCQSQTKDQNPFWCYFRPQMSENFFSLCKGTQLLLRVSRLHV